MSDGSAAVPSRSSTRRARIEALKLKVESVHRAVLEKDVLQGLLPIRARTMVHREASPDARDREARFREVCTAYAREISDYETPASGTCVVTLDSLTWWVPLILKEDPSAVEHALRHQDFPYRVITQTREVALGGLMLDVGANTGRMCIPRVILGDVTAAYCAEPDPLNYRCLVRNVRANQLTGLVLPDQLAIGAENGLVRLERGKSTGGHRVIANEARATREVLEVRSLTLDAWVDQLGIDRLALAFIKVDVQGSEVHVLRGAARTLAHKHIAWQMEVDLNALATRGFSAEDLYVLLGEHFSDFVDLSRRGVGERVQPVTALQRALAYLSTSQVGRTDLLLFNMEPSPRVLQPMKDRHDESRQ